MTEIIANYNGTWKEAIAEYGTSWCYDVHI